jgi:hypothetical protein
MSTARRPIRIFLAMAILSAGAGSAQAAQGPCEVLKVDDPGTSLSSSGRFGNSVSLRGSVLVIGEPGGGTTWPPQGRAHILEQDTTTGAWTLAATLSPSAADAGGFGFSVATDGQTVVVGAPESGYLSCTGAAYVFERQGDGAWAETAKLVPPDKVWGFGYSCAVEQDRIVVGAKGVSAFDGGTGRVVVFQRSGTSWTQTAVIKPSPSVGGDGFGHRLDLQGDRLVVGASYGWLGACVPFCEGRAFVFERSLTSSAWVQTAMLAPADLEDWDYFG